MEKNIIVYKPEKGDVKVYLKIEKETLWLDAHQIASVFCVDRSVIVKHIQNIYKNKELVEKGTCAKIAQVARDGKKRKMNIFNLDVVIAVGYRVNSKIATSFRVWATKTLHQYLVKGYVLNQKRLKESKLNSLKELQKTISLIQDVAFRKQFEQGEMLSLLNVIKDYTKSWILLQKYDQGDVVIIKGKTKASKQFTYDFVRPAVDELKQALMKINEASDLFGNERDGTFDGIIKTIYQTFAGVELYSSLEEKAAHLLYFIIKDHPFSDGNKRIGAFLFVLFLNQNRILYRKSGERKINDNTLVALALLVAESNPKEKEQMVALITQLLK